MQQGKKRQGTYKGTPIRLSADFSMEFYKPEVNGMIYLGDEREETTTKNTVPTKTLLQI